MDLLLEAAYVISRDVPAWLRYAFGGLMLVGALCAVSWLHGAGRYRSDR